MMPYMFSPAWLRPAAWYSYGCFADLNPADLNIPLSFVDILQIRTVRVTAGKVESVYEAYSFCSLPASSWISYL